MSVRFLIASFVSGVLLLTTGSFLGAGEPKMITKVYPVADLVIPFDNGNLSVNLQNDGSRAEVASVATPAQIGSTPPPASREYVTPPAHAAKTCPLCPKPYPPASPSSSVPRKPAKTTEEALMKLLTGRIAPKTWAHNGGEGKIEYYPLGLAVVVTQTPEVQEQVAELLTALRRAQDTEVALEVRFVTVTDKCLARVSQDFGLAPKLCDARLGLKGEFCKLGPVFLNDAGTLRFMEAIQSSRRTTVMQAPKLTVFNGVESSLNVTDSQYFVTGLHLVPAGDQPGYVPENKPVSTGFHLSVQPAVSADRRYVTMNLNAEQTSIASVGMFPVTTYITPVFEGGAVGQPVPFTQFIQQPKLTTLSVQKTFSVPDGGTVLLTGWKPLHGPHLEKKPLVAQVLDALCPLPASAQETDMVILMVTPRIIVDEQEERRLPASKRYLASPKIVISEEEELKAVPGLGSVNESNDLTRLAKPAKASAVVEILANYQQACTAGRLSEARELAKKALAIDPTCFSQNFSRRQQGKDGGR